MEATSPRSTTPNPIIDTFAIEPDGRFVTSSIDYAKHALNNDCPAPTRSSSITLVHPLRSGIQRRLRQHRRASFALNKRTGKLHYLGIDITGVFPGDNNAAYFIGNNVYAYTAVNSGCMYYGIYGFRRQPSGLLASGE